MAFTTGMQAQSQTSEEPTRDTEALTEKELVELAGYNKIIAFHGLVESGRHSKYRIPQHVLVRSFRFLDFRHPQRTHPSLEAYQDVSADLPKEQNTSCAEEIAITELKVDSSKDYYKDLGVASHVSQSAIWKGFTCKCE